MNDDLRSHDPTPTDEERAWMETNPLPAAVRLAVLLVLAFAIGGYAGLLFNPSGEVGSVAEAPAR